MKEKRRQNREFSEIIYDKKDGVARITINRPEKLNALTPLGMYEIIQALWDAWGDNSIGVVVLTGAGDKAFCAGGDRGIRRKGDYAEPMTDLPRGVLPQQLAQLIRSIPKPVIARVNGYAIGGGNVYQVACDLSIASETAQFGQAGPKMGGFFAGIGTGDLARCVGMRKAKEMWYLCRRYTAKEALDMGLVNCVVPPDKLDEEVDKWCKEILAKSPTAIRMLKHSFHAEWDGIIGITSLGMACTALIRDTDEAKEGRKAYLEKREPDFSKFRK